MKKLEKKKKPLMVGGPCEPVVVCLPEENPKLVTDRKDLDRQRREPRQHAQVVGRLAGVKEKK